MAMGLPAAWRCRAQRCMEQPCGGGSGTATGWPDAGYGTLFKIQIDGSNYTDYIRQFTASDGRGPYGTLVLSGTTLYGTTEGGYSSGGSYDGGTIFKINTDGSGYTLLHNFIGPPTDGAVPYGGLISSGTTLYGVTTQGGSYGYSPSTYDYGDGTVLRSTWMAAVNSVLKQFSGDDGAWPYAGLLLDGAALYGTTSAGGISNSGVVFAVYLSEVPAIVTNPQSQTAESGSNVFFSVHADGAESLSFQWFFDGTNALGCATTNAFLRLTNLQATAAGAYTVVATNDFGAMTSAPAMLNVIAPVQRRPVPGVEVTGETTSVVNVDSANSLRPVPNWTSLGSVSLAGTPQYCFDLTLPLPPQSFYRAWQTGTPGVRPSLDLHLVPAITLTGTIGHSVRLDYINQFGPTDAWVTLATVPLTNTSQLYFDISAPGQPPRLYRLVQVP